MVFAASLKVVSVSAIFTILHDDDDACTKKNLSERMDF